MKTVRTYVRAVLTTCLFTLGVSTLAFAEAAVSSSSPVAGWAFFSAALVTGMSGIGAGIAVAYVGAAAVGAISEKPEVAGKTILYVGLAEGIAILGFGIAFIILSKV